MGIKLGINPEDVSTEFPVAPAGTYPCTIDKADLEESKSEKNKGKPLLVIRFKPIEPIDCFVGDKKVTISDRALFTTWLPLWNFENNSEMSFNGLKRLVEAIGKPGIGWRNGELFPEEFMGQQLKVAVEVEDSEGRGKQNRVTGTYKL